MENPELSTQNFEGAQEQSGDILVSLKNDLSEKIEDPHLESIALQKADKLDVNSESFSEQSKDLLKAFKNIEKSILKVDKPGKELFLSFLETSINSDMLLQIIADNRGRKLKKYTKKNGYVINDETLDFFNKSLGSDSYSIKKREEKIQENSFEIEKETEFIEESEEFVKESEEFVEEKSSELFKNITKAKNISELYKNGVPEDKLEGLSCKDKILDLKKVDIVNDNPEDIITKQKELLEYFTSSKKGQQEFKIYLSLLQTHNKEQYQNFVNYVKSENIQVLTNIIHEFDPEQKRDPYGGGGEVTKKAIQEAAVGRYEDIEGQNVEFDMSEVPPIRKFSVEGGNYIFESELGISVFYEAMVRYEEAKQNIERTGVQLKTEYRSLKSKLEGNKSDIEDKEDEIKLMKSLGNPTNDLEQELSLLKDNTETIKQALLLKREEIINNNTELSSLNLEYARDLDSLINTYKEQLEAEDLKRKEVGLFIKQIGFDLIPQNIIDSVLSQLNSNNGLRSALGFTTEFDLEEGILGFEDTSNSDLLSSKEKVKFAELYNIMISGNKNEPLVIDNIRNGSGEPFQDRNTFQGQLENAGLKDSGTGISIAMKNLETSLHNIEK